MLDVRVDLLGGEGDSWCEVVVSVCMVVALFDIVASLICH
jgi:hypothetical protein